MSALDAASALADGFARARVATELIPLGDGGQGTAAALFEALGFTGDWHGATVSGPLGHRFSDAAFLLLPDGLAIMESSEAIGRSRLFGEPNDVLRASSRCAVFGARIEIALEGAEMYEVKLDLAGNYRSLYDLGRKLGRSLR